MFLLGTSISKMKKRHLTYTHNLEDRKRIIKEYEIPFVHRLVNKFKILKKIPFLWHPLNCHRFVSFLLCTHKSQVTHIEQLSYFKLISILIQNIKWLKTIIDYECGPCNRLHSSNDRLIIQRDWRKPETQICSN